MLGSSTISPWVPLVPECVPVPKNPNGRPHGECVAAGAVGDNRGKTVVSGVNPVIHLCHVPLLRSPSSSHLFLLPQSLFISLLFLPILKYGAAWEGVKMYIEKNTHSPITQTWV